MWCGACNTRAGIVTRRPIVLQLHKIEEGGREYAEFLHLPRKRFTDFGTINYVLIVISLSLLITCYRWWVGVFFFFFLFLFLDDYVLLQLLWERKFKMKPIGRLDEQNRFQVSPFILVYILPMVCLNFCFLNCLLVALHVLSFI